MKRIGAELGLVKFTPWHVCYTEPSDKLYLGTDWKSLVYSKTLSRRFNHMPLHADLNHSDLETQNRRVECSHVVQRFRAISDKKRKNKGLGDGFCILTRLLVVCWLVGLPQVHRMKFDKINLDENAAAWQCQRVTVILISLHRGGRLTGFLQPTWTQDKSWLKTVFFITVVLRQTQNWTRTMCQYAQKRQWSDKY